MLCARPLPFRYGGFSTLKPLLQEQLSYTDSILFLTGPQASLAFKEMFDRCARVSRHTASRRAQQTQSSC